MDFSMCIRKKIEKKKKKDKEAKQKKGMCGEVEHAQEPSSSKVNSIVDD